MKKAVKTAANIGKAILPMAADAGKLLLDTALKGAVRLGKLILSVMKSKGTKKALKKGRKFLRITALISGSVALLSCAGLILSRRK